MTVIWLGKKDKTDIKKTTKKTSLRKKGCVCTLHTHILYVVWIRSKLLMHLPCFSSHPRTTLEKCISWTPFGWNWSSRCAPTANGSKLKLTSKTGPSDPQHHPVLQVNSYWMHYLAVQKETEMRETLQGTKIKLSSVHISCPRGTLRFHCFKDEYMSTKEAHLFVKPKKIAVCT